MVTVIKAWSIAASHVELHVQMFWKQAKQAQRSGFSRRAPQVLFEQQRFEGLRDLRIGDVSARAPVQPVPKQHVVRSGTSRIESMWITHLTWVEHRRLRAGQHQGPLTNLLGAPGTAGKDVVLC